MDNANGPMAEDAASPALVPPVSPPGATAGNQEQSGETVYDAIVPLQGAHVTNFLLGVAAANPRGLGHDVTSKLVVRTMMQMEYSLNEQRLEINRLGEANKLLERDLSEFRERNARLEERAGFTNVRSFSGAAGTILLGLAFELAKTQKLPALMLGLIGAAMLIFSFSFTGIWKKAKP